MSSAWQIPQKHAEESSWRCVSYFFQQVWFLLLTDTDHGVDILAMAHFFGTLNGFSTHNFADGYHPLLYQTGNTSLKRQAPELPPLQTMHKLADVLLQLL